jgi:hypothetical protein
VTLALFAVACGPEINTPASTNVSGTWFALGPAAGLTNVSIQLEQKSDGTISGTYKATGKKPTQFCPPKPPCSISDTITGTNTVLEVYFELQHAGQFAGQLIGADRLTGSMARLGFVEPIEFSRSLTLSAAGP